jgi:hypothetical protein
MTISFACPDCGAGGSVGAAFAGRSARCKQCGHRFTIPGPGAREPDVYALDEPSGGPAPAAPASPGSVFVASRGDGSPAPAPVAPRRPRRAASATARRPARADGPGVAWRAWLVRLAAAFALALVATALLAPRGTLIAGCALMALGSLMVLVGYAAGAYGAFREDFLYGFLYVVIPLYTAYYLVTRWDDLWPWFACSTAGVGLVLLGTELVRWAGVTA